MKTNLKVPFAEKDEAKQLGARWNAVKKVWYVEDKDLTPFARWLPDGLPAPGAPSNDRQTSGIFITGSRFVEAPRVCDCLPWAVCDKCAATALASKN